VEEEEEEVILDYYKSILRIREMISASTLQKVAVTFVAGKFQKSCFRTINKSSFYNSIKINVMENDMVRTYLRRSDNTKIQLPCLHP
jgi:hypothetical protein